MCNQHFCFQKGPLSGNYFIRGIKHVSDTKDLPNVEIISGGIGYKHATIIVTSHYGQGLASNFVFFGEKAEY